MLSDRKWARKYINCHPLSPFSFIMALLGHYAIRIYLATALGSVAIFFLIWCDPLKLLLAGFFTVIFYPIVEYCLHRYVLHSTMLCRSPVFSELWRRLHYDHHMEPSDLSVLFADPLTSLPLIIGLAALIGYPIAGNSLFCAMVFTNSSAFLYYEFMHAACHLPLETDSAWFRIKKQEHLFHHYTDERKNFGIGTSIIDQAIGVGLLNGPIVERSSTVRNLGYDDTMASKYPWVASSYKNRNNDT
jgi:sterol desaturase/sphingolipid hydroxylase (fatty acid hydroxylase superfamily)